MVVDRATIDIETRSPVDLPACGAHIYAMHPETEVLCLAYHVPGMADVDVWYPGRPDPDRLVDWILSGGAIEAHNAAFERAVLTAHPPDWWINPARWLCSAAQAAAVGLPRKLEDVASVLNLVEQKDMEGHRLMKLVSQTKNRGKTTADQLDRLYEYCKQDVRTEMAVSAAVPDLSDFEQQLFDLDSRINDRGVCVDVDLAEKANELARLQQARLARQFEAITGIEKPTQVKRIKEWLAQQDIHTDTLNKERVEWILSQPDTPENVKQALGIRLSGGKASVTKYRRMLMTAHPVDHRVRGLLQYHGATTGRWAGRLFQPQNLPRGNLGKGESMDDAVDEIMGLPASEETLDYIGLLYGDPLDRLSSTLRGALIAGPGRELVVADFAAIEARATLWLAGDKNGLNVFRSGRDIYLDMASVIFGYPCDEDHKWERQMGKIAILGLGYGMGFVKLLITCRTMYKVTISPKQARSILRHRYDDYMEWTKEAIWPTDPRKKALAGFYRKALADTKMDPKAVLHELAACAYITKTYRSRYPDVPDLWRAYGDAARATLEDGEARTTGKVTWYMDRGHLLAALPSGRDRVYWDASIGTVMTAWGEKQAKGIRYWRETPKGWRRSGVYGGLLTENVAQSVARDLMAESMLAIDAAEGYELILTVHDEVICEVDEGMTDKAEFKRLMTGVPEWAEGFPIDSDVSVMRRYRK